VEISVQMLKRPLPTPNSGAVLTSNLYSQQLISYQM